MGRYISRQLASIIPTIFLSIVLNFILLHSAPGDPARIMAGMDNPSPEQIAAIRSQLGLDKPLPVQFFNYVKQLAQGNLGQSITYKQPVFDLIMSRLPATLLLTVTSAVIALVIGTLLGAFAAQKSGKPVDSALSFGNYALFAVPSFWLGLIMIVIFSSKLGWLPTSGMRTVRADYTGWRDTLDVLQHLVLPVATLALVQIPIYFRITRASVVQQQREDYVTTFRATGIPETRIFRRYALRNGLLPTVTLFGLSLGFVFTGAALVEIVFAWPGIGRLTLDAVFRRDYPLLLGIYLVLAIAVSLAVLITDLVYALLDPRIRLR
ncbi:MAG TPA: ABC transporter permease [Thermomicrobiales bacterium]|nr:ABC transporter permease [Thermomicrobiales bacterium]